MSSKVRILILGATGMLGHTLLEHLTGEPGFEVHGTVRNREGLSRWFPPELITAIREVIRIIMSYTVYINRTVWSRP